MTRSRWTIWTSLAAVLLLTGGTMAQAPAPETDASEENKPRRAAEVQIKVDRSVGLTPLKIRISGTLLDADHKETALHPDQKVFLEAESSYLRSSANPGSGQLYNAGVAELDSAGTPDPLRRELEIQRAGTYFLRLVVKDSDGNELRSNRVRVKAM